jgi:hypothetical protein
LIIIIVVVLHHCCETVITVTDYAILLRFEEAFACVFLDGIVAPEVVINISYDSLYGDIILVCKPIHNPGVQVYL